MKTSFILNKLITSLMCVLISIAYYKGNMNEVVFVGILTIIVEVQALRKYD
jgi:hypothetical protein